MYRLLIVLLGSALLTAPAWPQEPGEDSDDVENVETQAEEPEEPEIDETGLDEQGFEDRDDDFTPTEEIPTDQSIEFPTDI